jgi:hypothetical protein
MIQADGDWASGPMGGCADRLAQLSSKQPAEGEVRKQGLAIQHDKMILELTIASHPAALLCVQMLAGWCLLQPTDMPHNNHPCACMPPATRSLSCVSVCVWGEGGSRGHFTLDTKLPLVAQIHPRPSETGCTRFKKRYPHTDSITHVVISSACTSASITAAHAHRLPPQKSKQPHTHTHLPQVRVTLL